MLTRFNSTKAQRRAQALQQLQKKKPSKPRPINNKPKDISASVSRNSRRRQRRRIASSGPMGLENAYRLCRLAPFKSHGLLTGIPDASTGKRLLVDHRIAPTITFGDSGQCSIIVAPALPSPLWVKFSDTDAAINGTQYPDNVTTNVMIPLCLAEWVNQPATWLAAGSDNNFVDPLYTSSKFRVVTVAWSLNYIGSDLNNSGLITVNSFPLTVQPPAPNTGTFTVYSSTSSVNTNIGSDEVQVSLMSTELTPLQLKSFINNIETFRTPLKRGAHGVLRHSAGDYPDVPLYSAMTYISDPEGQPYSKLMQLTPVPDSAGASGVVQGFDNSWDPTLINISGGSPNQSFVLDLLMCVEYYPQPSSSVISLAKAGPPENRSLLQSVENAAKALPIASAGSALDTTLRIGQSIITAFA